MTTVLVIEDDASLRRALRTSLRARAFDVIECATSEEGLVQVADVEEVTADAAVPEDGERLAVGDAIQEHRHGALATARVLKLAVGVARPVDHVVEPVRAAIEPIAGVAHERVDPAEVFQRSRDEHLAIGSAGHVGAEAKMPAAELAVQFFQSLDASRAQCQLRPRRRELLRQRRADPGTGAADRHDHAA